MVVRSSGLFLRMPFHWDLPDVSLVIRLGLWVLEKKATESRAISITLY